MATAPSANDLTRQQLDELDALLQRMLSLPMSTSDAPPAPPPPPASPPWRVDGPSLAQAPAARLTAPPEPLPPPVRPPVFEAPPAPPPMPAPEPTTPIIERKVIAPSQMPIPVRQTPLPVVPPLAEEIPPVPFYLWPFVALNWLFDRLVGLFGPPGWLLRSGFGKTVLGFVGIGLLVYTAAHVAIERGWLTLPFPVPWPR
jgi:hypothetical protein